ncbi:MAG: FecR domain-containing protein [Verrucomicrobia bacterium]|nr:FecR domain-containing protein [Verrucomicrobiota bacterium]
MNPAMFSKRVVGLAFCCVVAMTLTVNAAPRPSRAVVVNLTGKADYQQRGEDWKNMHRGVSIAEGASARTATNSIADFFLSTEARTRITQNTIIRFDQLQTKTTGLPQADKKPTAFTNIELERGKILVRAFAPTKQSSFVVTTRSCLTEVRGFGAYSVWLLNNRACVRVMDETVTLLIRGRADPVVLQAGQQLCVECDPRTNEAIDRNVQPTTVTDPDPDWPPLPPPTGPGPGIEPPPVYEISPSQPQQ